MERINKKKMQGKTKIAIAVALLALYVLSLVSFASAVIITDVSMTPDEVAPGETSKIEIDIKNDLDYDITDVSISLDLVNLPFAPYKSSSSVNFDEIDEDESEDITFEIIALNDAESKIYKVPVKISYSDEGGVPQPDKFSLISVLVNSEPVMGVNFEDSLLLRGNNEKVSIKVINKGLSGIRFLEVQLGSSMNYDILSQDNVYIGDIESDDFDNVDFDVYFKGDISGDVNLPVILKYKDSTNKEYVESFNIPVKVYSREKAIELGLMEKSNTGLYVGVIVGLIVVYIVYRNFRKWIKKRKVNNGF